MMHYIVVSGLRHWGVFLTTEEAYRWASFTLRGKPWHVVGIERVQ